MMPRTAIALVIATMLSGCGHAAVPLAVVPVPAEAASAATSAIAWNDGGEAPATASVPEIALTPVAARALVGTLEPDQAERARAAWSAIDTGMSVPKAHGFLAWLAVKLHLKPPAGALADGRGKGPASVWSFGQAIAGALDVAMLTKHYEQVDTLMAVLPRYRRGQAYAPDLLHTPNTARYWDDNAWIGLDLVQAYAQTGQKSYLDRAMGLLPYFESGLSKAGGIYWVERNRHMTRNTCANGPAIELMLRLYAATKNPRCLALARNCQAFLDASMRAPNGLYYDNVGDDGQVSRAIYSYNQGTPIGANVLFYQLTGEASYLERATTTANAALDYYGQDDRLWTSAPSFNAIFFRNLLALDAVAPNPRYRQALASYLTRVWNEARNPQTGLFDRGGIGSYGPEKGSLLDESGLVQLFALMAWPLDQLGHVS